MSKELNKGITENDMRMYFGENADTYVDYWKAVVLKQEDVQYKKWHWPAFFTTVLWLMYRKLYVSAAIILTFVIGSSLIEAYFELEVSKTVDNAINIGISVALGLYARQIAVTEAIKKITTINSKNLTTNQREEMIKQSGGTTFFAPIALVVVFALLLGTLIYFEI